MLRFLASLCEYMSLILLYVVCIVCVSSNNSQPKSLNLLICIRLDKLSGSDGNTTIDETEESVSD